MKYISNDHTFAVCAYQTSPYLEKCIRSLEAQLTKSKIIICTATPNDYIRKIAENHNIPLYINSGAHGIAEDWNFAYSQAKTRLVTLAHQDDIYDPEYTQEILRAASKAKNPLIIFPDYYEIRDDRKVYADQFLNLRIKQILLLPLRGHLLRHNRLIKKRVLSLGNPIGCPSVTYVTGHLEPPFDVHFKSNVDWETWSKYADMPGDFVYIHKPLMGHRIHEESTTSKIVGDGQGRMQEDLEMLSRFWPQPVARLINRFYARSQKTKVNR